MKNLPAEIKTHIAGEVTTLCRCWVIELTTGETFGFTDHDNDLTVAGVLCEKEAGVESSGIEERIGFAVDSSEVSGALQSDRITEDHIRAGRYDGGKVTTYLVNWNAPAEYAVDRVMLIGDITQKDGHFLLEMRGLSSALDQTGGRHFIKYCQADLGDNKCQVDLSAAQNSASGLVVFANSEFSLEVANLDEFVDGWFTYGHLQWTSGHNSDRGVEIATHVKASGRVSLSLWEPMPSQPVAGDAFTITIGCDKRFATCKAKFANAINFQGFPYMPGDGFALTHAANSENFDGGPIVP